MEHFIWFLTFTHVGLVDLKDDKETPKPEEATKLQNGDGSKEGAAPATTAASASSVSEEKKKAKTRFMFNIADGGFTGAHTSAQQRANHRRPPL